MRAVTRYAFVQVRIGGLKRRLLDARTLEGLLAARSLDDVPLDRAGLREVDGGAAAVGEHDLAILLLAEAWILARPLTGRARDFLKFWGYQFELGNLKTMVRGIAAGLERDRIAEALVPLGPFATMPYDDLLRCEDVSELLRRLERSPHAELIRDAGQRLAERGAPFEVEATIDQRFHVGLVRRAELLDRTDRTSVLALLGPMIDRVNLVWLLRFRLAYALSPGETYYLLVPGGRRLSAALLQDLAQRRTLEDIVADLPDALRRLLEGACNVAEVDRLLDEDVERLAQSIVNRALFSLGPVFAYLVVRQKQIERLQALSRGLALGFDGALIREASRLSGGNGSPRPG